MESFGDIWTFLAGLASGGIGGSLITLAFNKKEQKVTGSGNVTDQSGAKAGGDITGRDKNN